MSAKTHTTEAVVTPAAATSQEAEPTEGDSIFSNKIATVALVGLGAALIEVELIPGMLLGVAAMMAPNLFPKVGKALRPLLKETVRAGYSLAGRARESMAEMSEQVQDIVAEVKTEQQQQPAIDLQAERGGKSHAAPEAAQA